MIRALLGRTTAAGLACVVVCAAFGQEKPASPAPPAPAPAEKPDEIIVSRQTPTQLRAEIEKAENAFYDLFNSLNSSDEFDIHCQRVVPTGRRVPERVCQPNFMSNEQSAAGKSTTLGVQGSTLAGNSQEATGAASVKRQQLEAEIKKLASENAELGAALARLGNLQQALSAAEKKK
jgi:hypothetical protein